MSIVLTAHYGNEEFQVEIKKDGDLVFLDYDFDYDLSMVEFGEPQTNAIKLLNKWKLSTTDAICENLDIEKYQLAYLASDWAKHVLPIFLKYRKEDKRPNTAIKAARIYINSINKKNEQKEKRKLANAVTEAWTAADTTWPDSARVAAEAAWAAAHATQTISTIADIHATAVRTATIAAFLYSIKDAALAARNAVGADVWERAGTEKSMKARSEEMSWQTRRFIDCMEAVQAGKPWPPLGATK